MFAEGSSEASPGADQRLPLWPSCEPFSLSEHMNLQVGVEDED